MYPFIYIFGKTVGTYGLMSVVGILVSAFIACRLAKHKNIPPEDIILLSLSIIAGVFAGGHLLYGITRLPDLLNALLGSKDISFNGIVKLFAAAFGGMVFYGGLLGGTAAIVIHTRFSASVKCSQALDIFAVIAPLFHTFGRIGCFLGGCCYGIECKFGFTADNNPFVPEINGVKRFPVQLTEAALNFLIFIIMYKFYKHGYFKGHLIFAYYIFYAAVRFGTEFLRGDTVRGFIGVISTSQLISIIIFGICMLIPILKRLFVASNGFFHRSIR